MSSSEKIESKFIVNRARDNPFLGGGLRVYREYRDLGIAAATGGRVHAHIIRTTAPCSEGGGLHYRELEFQMVMVRPSKSGLIGIVELDSPVAIHQPGFTLTY